MSGQDREAPDEYCVFRALLLGDTEVKAIAAVIFQAAQGAEQGPFQRDMLGSVGVYQEA